MVHKDLLHWPEPAVPEKQPAAETVEGAAGVGDEGTAKAGVEDRYV